MVRKWIVLLSYSKKVTGSMPRVPLCSLVRRLGKRTDGTAAFQSYINNYSPSEVTLKHQHPQNVGMVLSDTEDWYRSGIGQNFRFKHKKKQADTTSCSTGNWKRSIEPSLNFCSTQSPLVFVMWDNTSQSQSKVSSMITNVLGIKILFIHLFFLPKNPLLDLLQNLLPVAWQNLSAC